MRVLHFALLTPESPQHGMRNALKAIATDGYEEFSWYPYWTGKRLPQMRDEFLDRVKIFGPDLVWCQIQTPNLLPRHVLDQIRCRCKWLVSWCGDLRDETPQWAIQAAPNMDLMLFSNERDVANMKAKGMPSEFLNIGFSTEVFRPDGDKRPRTPEVVFLGSNYPNRFPCSAQRQRLVATLRSRYGDRFGVYGNGWGPNEPFLPEPQEAACYRACRIAIDTNHYQNVPRFTSDRRFRAMGSGAFVLANWHPGFEQDFTDGEHLIAWRREGEIPQLIDHWLTNDEERKRIAAAGCAHVHQHHTWESRFNDLMSMLPKYQRKAAA